MCKQRYTEVCSWHWELHGKRSRRLFGKDHGWEFEELSYDARPQAKEDHNKPQASYTYKWQLGGNWEPSLQRRSCTSRGQRQVWFTLTTVAPSVFGQRKGGTCDQMSERSLRRNAWRQAAGTADWLPMSSGLTLPLSSGFQSLSSMYVPHQCHLASGVILVFQNSQLVFGRQQVDFRLVFRSFLCELRNLAWSPSAHSERELWLVRALEV